jgi:hypothetical protein
MKFVSTLPDQEKYLENNFKNCLLNPIPLPDSLWFPNNIQPLDE